MTPWLMNRFLFFTVADTVSGFTWWVPDGGKSCLLILSGTESRHEQLNQRLIFSGASLTVGEVGHGLLLDKDPAEV